MGAVGVLIEREVELAALGELIAAALAGRGGAALVGGEAGIGKTRLLTRAREEASRAGVRVLYATADEIEANVPLAVARVLLARAARAIDADGPARLAVLALKGQLAEPGALGSRADEVVHALWWLIAELADEGPLALVVDDAQWADDLTLALLRVAARRAPALPLALVVGARPAALGLRHAALAAEPAFGRVRPAPLSVAGTARMVEDLLGRPQDATLAVRVRELAGGNPLYVSELLAWARAHDAGIVLPIGVQLIARHGAENTLLRTAAGLEAALPWQNRHAPRAPRRGAGMAHEAVSGGSAVTPCSRNTASSSSMRRASAGVSTGSAPAVS